MGISISELWHSTDVKQWKVALERYSDFVRRENKDLELALDNLSLEELSSLDEHGWYAFLKDKYFRWKYTTPNRYKTTTRQLEKYIENNQLNILNEIRKSLLSIPLDDVRVGLKLACSINGLGTAGASGLLSLMYPETFGTVDQFVVKALREVSHLPESESLIRMNPESLSISDGIILNSVMQRKAAENNMTFATNFWTPRKIDKILWTYGRN